MGKKINKAKVLDTLMNLPDVVWQGPLLEYKKEYKDLVKKMRRGTPGEILSEEAQYIAVVETEKYLQSKQ